MNDPAAPAVTPVGPLVVGYDDHASSRRALAYAVQLAARLNVTLHVLHVIDLEDYPVDPDSATWEEQADQHEQLLAGHVRSLVRLPQAQWTYQVTRGDPWHALVTHADQQDAWLIVVGQHTHARLIGGAVSRLLGAGSGGGAVPASLIRRGHRPVLVVPSAEDDDPP